MDQREIESLRARVAARGPHLTLDGIAFGAHLSTSWLQKFAGGKIKEPRLKNFSALKRFMDTQRRAA